MENSEGNVVSLEGMYKDYFLDYASYVILERAVPSLYDGLKPVQRRILHAMQEKEDGRFNKVANIIGNTMQYHPHGDAAIGDALVKLGQKDVLIDTQGNWGDPILGDAAAAPRYIEARLSPFAKEVAFNKETTDWQLSYDGRKNEPILLPMKFPLLLLQGGEGIAVGLSTKILPHNFNELIDGSIAILRKQDFDLYPDFPTAGYVDVSNYNEGKRGGKVRVRAHIEKFGKNQLKITELPFGPNTNSLIESILKANAKGKIKIKKVVDNTAKDVEILIDLAAGVSPDVTIDALYAFTDCEISISANACVIDHDKPVFLSVKELLRQSTQHTKELLQWELENERAALEEKWHFASLEKIFIENRVYREIEECETWEAVIETIDTEMRKYIAEPTEQLKPNDQRIQLKRAFTEDDIIRLTEIRIKRISKFNTFKADEQIIGLEEALDKVNKNLKSLTRYTITYFERLRKKYGKDRSRRTRIATFDEIALRKVAANNTKLYADLKGGFIGWDLKKEDFIADCSDIDDVISFRKDCNFSVVRIDSKVFVGKNIIHTNVWRKGDDRTTYNLIYLDGKTGRAMAKRFQVKSITRDKAYPLGGGHKLDKVLYFTANANAESEIVRVQLTASSKARNKILMFDFSELSIKGRSSKGNIVTRYPIKSISRESIGESTLGDIDIWMDPVSGSLNVDERGDYIGAFGGNDFVLTSFNDGSIRCYQPEDGIKVHIQGLQFALKADLFVVITMVYYDQQKDWTILKRFQIEKLSFDEAIDVMGDNRKCLLCTTEQNARLAFVDDKGKDQLIDIDAFIDVKGWKAMGNRLCNGLAKKISLKAGAPKIGDTIEMDINID